MTLTLTLTLTLALTLTLTSLATTSQISLRGVVVLLVALAVAMLTILLTMVGVSLGSIRPTAMGMEELEVSGLCEMDGVGEMGRVGGCVRWDVSGVVWDGWCRELCEMGRVGFV